ncbi:MAG TPA: CotH kinase family protein [Bacteroidia bacterium]
MDFVKTVGSNYWNGRKADPESISIEIKNKDLNILEKNRQNALERGVIINDQDGEYVSATLEYKGKKIKVKLRLKGHMTDHLQDNKWSFRIKIKDNESFMGMKRFSIQHPGTRGYIYEWIYHELMKREDVIALRYKFINVSVNGKDWGIYAVEENFDEELIENNNRKKGPIIRFNPDLYWVDRFNELKRSQPLAEFASYYSSYVQAYRDDKILKDSVQRLYYLKAMALMEGFRTKKLSASETFDIERLARFHAVIDLVGGIHSIDWSDIKYYYNPVTAKLEPVAYESFTVFPFQHISGNYKFTQPDSLQPYKDFHTAIFSDERFFRAYIKQLRKISDPSYLDTFFSSSDKELTDNLRILNKEFPYKKFDKTNYYLNQKMIRQILSAPKSVHTYFKKVSDNKVLIQAGAIESLPVELLFLSSGKIKFYAERKSILPAKQANEYVKYKDLLFVMPDGFIWNDSLLQDLKLNYTILGEENIQQADVFPYPHTETEFITEDLKNRTGNIKSFPFLVINEESSTIIIKPGNNKVDKDLIVPAGYRVMASAGVTINMVNGAKLISYSPFIFTGNEEENILITSTDSSSQGIEFINSDASVFEYVVIRNMPVIKDEQWTRKSYLTFYESPVVFKQCSFYNGKSEFVLNIIRSKFALKECMFKQMRHNAVKIDFSEGSFDHCVFEECVNNALDLTMAKVKISGLYISGSSNKALNIKNGTQLTGGDITIKHSGVAISVEDKALVTINKVDIIESRFGIAAFKNHGGHPSVKISGLTLKGVSRNYIKDVKSFLQINGAGISESVENVENIIQSGKKKHS